MPKLSPKLLLLSVILPLQALDNSAQRPNAVIDWNRNLLSIVRTPGVQPATMHSTRSFAMLHLAMKDAIETVEGRGENDTLQNIAGVAAAHRLLAKLYPTQESVLDQDYQVSLAALPKVRNFTEAIAIGRRSADRVLRERANDGSNLPPAAYDFGNAPGDYQSTPPNFPKQPQFTSWSNVLPFVLLSSHQFRSVPPPSLSSELYAKSLHEVETLGSSTDSTATREQMLIGKFWNGSIQNYWNEIAQSGALAKNLDTVQTARLFASLNVALADSVIAFYDSKYQYNLWRPVTAIRLADPQLTPGAQPNPVWLPETQNTAPDPSYPGAHAVISAAAAEILIAALNTDALPLDVTSEVMSGAIRHFDSLSDAAAEATRSRVYAGAHFSFDLTAGERLGRSVAGYVLEHDRGRSF